MRTTEIKCDACGADLLYTGNIVDYRLVLASEGKSHRGNGAVTDMMIYPPVDRSYHFCGLRCLDYWRDRARYADKLHAKKTEEWKQKVGHRSPVDGRVTSWISPPDDVQVQWNAEVAAEVEKVFPSKKNLRDG